MAVLVIGIIVVKVNVRILNRVFARTKMERVTQRFVITLIKLVLYVILVLIPLSVMGINISGIITALSTVILAIGFALEYCVTNVEDRGKTSL